MTAARFAATLLILASLVPLPAAGAPGAAGPLELARQNAPYRDLAPGALWLEDPDSALAFADAAAAYTEGAFRALPGPLIDFGFSESSFWLALPVRSAAATPEDWILSFNMRFMQRMTVHVLRDTGIEQVLDNRDTTPFGEREFRYRYLATQFRLAPGEQAVLLIGYWSEGTTALPLSIESAASMADLRSFHNVKNAVFYTFVAFMLIYTLLFLAALRLPVFRDYAFYLGLVVLYVAHMDGYTFQWLWPGWPVWNAYAALPLGLMLNVGAAVFSKTFLQTRTNHPRIHRMLNIIIVVTLGIIASSAVIDNSELKRYSFIYTFGCALCFLSFGIVAWLRQPLGARFYVVGWLGMTGAALFTSFSHWSSGMLAVGISFELIRIGILIDATMMALAILEQYAQVRKARDRATAEAARLATDKLDLQNRFFDLESRYTSAFQLAEQRGSALASASHDLRQPLGAMRMAMRDLSQDAEQQRLVTQSLAYLEQLVERYISVADADGAPVGADGNDPDLGGEETFAVSIVLENLRLMFEGQARSAGVRLIVRSSTAVVRANPIVLVRAVGNLITNALKHARARRVLLGCRRAPGALEICVIDDGAGMPGEQFDALFQRGARGDTDDASGHGLGLAIVRELADEHGYALRTASHPGRGTRVAIRVPRAASEAADPHAAGVAGLSGVGGEPQK